MLMLRQLNEEPSVSFKYNLGMFPVPTQLTLCVTSTENCLIGFSNVTVAELKKLSKANK